MTLDQEARREVAAGRAQAHQLWAILTTENQRDGYALKPLVWEGPGEYQHVTFDDGRDGFVRLTSDYRGIPTTQRKATGEWRVQQEANGTWSAYEGQGFRKGCFEARHRAERWIERQKAQDGDEQQPVAFVPVHPTRGYLWMDTYSADDDGTAERRSSKYPVAALYLHPDATGLIVALDRT